MQNVPQQDQGTRPDCFKLFPAKIKCFNMIDWLMALWYEITLVIHRQLVAADEFLPPLVPQ